MTPTKVKTILIIFILTNLLSCTGQIKTKKNQRELNTVKIGKTVSKLSNEIWAVFQDTKGDYWFGSNGEGVYHFDGKMLTLFTTNDNLASNSIRGFQEDQSGNIYIETPDGVSKFDGDKFTTLEIIQSPLNQWKLEENDLWFNCNATANHVYRYDGEKLYELQLPRKNIRESLGIDEFETSYSPYTVYGIDKDKSGNLWLGTILAGAYRFDGESFLWIGEKELSKFPDGRVPGVRSILEDNDGYIWLSNFKSKYKINPTTPATYEKQEAVALPQELIKDKILYFNSGLNDDEGNLWMTTYRGGVWKYDGKTLSNFEINNETETVLLISIFQDQEGKIWLGTRKDGVYVQNGNGYEKFKLKE